MNSMEQNLKELISKYHIRKNEINKKKMKNYNHYNLAFATSYNPGDPIY